ncbi:MAG TPA: TonB-dependent receptor [Flavobacterium sp.]|jgi:iron complex outermembrane receptor protein
MSLTLLKKTRNFFSRQNCLKACNCKVEFYAYSLLFLLFSTGSFAQSQDTLSAKELKRLSIEELMNINVTSVSKRAERITTAASAVQVITGEDIHNAGVKTLPEALRLAANLQVAQVNSSQWSISARGFNNVLANKLLVLIDGRTVYTPMYAGVFWDVQNVMLEDVDRIEVVSGPGGTLWGANAVNGVINIITKSSKETQGAFVETAYGNVMPGMVGARYGGKAGKDISYRFYGTGFRIDNSLNDIGRSANDHWGMSQGGLRADWEVSEKDNVSLIGNIYYGLPNPDGSEEGTEIAKGDNVILRWRHTFSDRSDFQLQTYYDHTDRHFVNGLEEDLKTYDIEWQNRFQPSQKHTFTFGLGARFMHHDMKNLELFGFWPAEKKLFLYNAFVQYEYQIIPEKLRLTIGSKIEHSTYSKFQHQPNARFAFTPNKVQTYWAAASRAIRNPSRIDRDFSFSLAPGVVFLQGSDEFGVESVEAFELGWRYQPLSNVNLSVSTFYNKYEGIRSAEPAPTVDGLPITLANGVEGNTFGAEIFIQNRISTWLNIRAGYTLVRKELRLSPGSADLNEATAESNDPAHQFLFQSNINLSKGFELGTVLRYIDRLPEPRVSGYTGLDLRIGWHLSEHLEINVVGQNLLQPSRTEFIAETPRREIERGLYGKLSWRL